MKFQTKQIIDVILLILISSILGFGSLFFGTFFFNSSEININNVVATEVKNNPSHILSLECEWKNTKTFLDLKTELDKPLITNVSASKNVTINSEKYKLLSTECYEKDKLYNSLNVYKLFGNWEDLSTVENSCFIGRSLSNQIGLDAAKLETNTKITIDLLNISLKIVGVYDDVYSEYSKYLNDVYGNIIYCSPNTVEQLGGDGLNVFLINNGFSYTNCVKKITSQGFAFEIKSTEKYYFKLEQTINDYVSFYTSPIAIVMSVLLPILLVTILFICWKRNIIKSVFIKFDRFYIFFATILFVVLISRSIYIPYSNAIISIINTGSFAATTIISILFFFEVLIKNIFANKILINETEFYSLDI